MQGLRSYSNDAVSLGLSATATAIATATATTPSSSSASCLSLLSIDVQESSETRIHRLVSEHPVILFSRPSCCMCHVMKSLLATIGVHPTVIVLDNQEITSALPNRAPAVFIGGTCIGGLESLVTLHLGGHLVPKLVEVGALYMPTIAENQTIDPIHTCGTGGVVQQLSHCVNH